MKLDLHRLDVDVEGLRAAGLTLGPASGVWATGFLESHKLGQTHSEQQDKVAFFYLCVLDLMIMFNVIFFDCFM